MAFVHKDGNKEGQVTRSKYLIISRDLERVFLLLIHSSGMRMAKM